MNSLTTDVTSLPKRTITDGVDGPVRDRVYGVLGELPRGVRVCVGLVGTVGQVRDGR